MNKILSKISGPLLVGSILALGTLASPVHADTADGPLIVFRAQAKLIDPPTIVADNGSEGTGGGSEMSPGDIGTGDTGGGSGDGDETGDGGNGGGEADNGGSTEQTAYFVAEYGKGFRFECKTEWTPTTLETYRNLIETNAVKFSNPEGGAPTFGGTEPVEGFIEPRGSSLFSVSHSLFSVYYRADGQLALLSRDRHPDDTRDFPENPNGDPLPCLAGTGTVTVGDTSKTAYAPLLNASIVYR
jgi:hypothetical protein